MSPVVAHARETSPTAMSSMRDPAPAAAVALVERQAEELVLAEELDEIPRELGRLVDFGGTRRNALARQRSDRGRESPAARPSAALSASAAILRAAGWPNGCGRAGGCRGLRAPGPPRRTAQAGVWPDEDPHDAGLHEEVDEVLRETQVDLPDAERSLTLVQARVVDVDVEPILVRHVARPNQPPCRRLRSPMPTRPAPGLAAA